MSRLRQPADDRFQRLLQERAQRLAPSEERTIEQPRVSGLDRLPASEAEAWIGAGTVAGFYGSEPPPPREPEPEPRPLAEPSAVPGELALTPNLSVEELARIRRAFALENHPDRVAPHQRELATRRMSIANALIDGALRTRAGTDSGRR